MFVFILVTYAFCLFLAPDKDKHLGQHKIPESLRLSSYLASLQWTFHSLRAPYLREQFPFVTYIHKHVKEKKVYAVKGSIEGSLNV